jgi:hypothetical protein
MLGLIFLIISCSPDDGVLEINIGEYDYHLAAWNTQNIHTYSLSIVDFNYINGGESAVVNVVNNIPINSIPPTWVQNRRKSTIPVFYTFIKDEEKRLRNIYKDGTNSCWLNVIYNTEYHYPHKFSTLVKYKRGKEGYRYWELILTPLVEE